MKSGFNLETLTQHLIVANPGKFICVDLVKNIYSDNDL